MLEPTTGRYVTQPTVGRIVHYRSVPQGACLAAIVTAVHDTGTVNLAVFDKVGDALQRHGIEQAADDDTIGGVWHWPERVQE